MLTEAERKLRSRLGGLANAYQNDPREYTKAGLLVANRDRYLKQVDAEFPNLPEAERQRKAELLRQIHTTSMSLKAVQARRKIKTGQDQGDHKC